MVDTGGAKARLEAAVKRLETAIDLASDRIGKEAAGTENLRQELKSLNSDLTKRQAENDRLSEQLSQAKSQYADIQSAIDKLSRGLDNAIDTVQTLLEEQPGT